jgi:hypothetical protein
MANSGIAESADAPEYGNIVRSDRRIERLTLAQPIRDSNPLPGQGCQRANLRRRRVQCAFSRLAESRREGRAALNRYLVYEACSSAFCTRAGPLVTTAQTDARTLGDLDTDEERIEEWRAQVVVDPGAIGISPGRGSTRFGQLRAGRNREGLTRGEKRLRRHPSAVGIGRVRAPYQNRTTSGSSVRRAIRTSG